MASGACVISISARGSGLERARGIRVVIERNRARLERVGTLRFVSATPEGGGPVATEYWLTFKQAMLVCMWARTERADEVQILLATVFEMHVRGELAKSPGVELAFPSLNRIEAGDLRRITVELQRLNLRQDQQAALIDEYIRKAFTRGVRADHLRILIGRGGVCPQCLEVVIVVDGKFVGAEYDHFLAVGRRDIRSTWVTCLTCNRRRNDPEFRHASMLRFMDYQETGVLPYLNRQARFQLQPRFEL